jgi:hypothetical protein
MAALLCAPLFTSLLGAAVFSFAYTLMRRAGGPRWGAAVMAALGATVAALGARMLPAIWSGPYAEGRYHARVAAVGLTVLAGAVAAVVDIREADAPPKGAKSLRLSGPVLLGLIGVIAAVQSIETARFLVSWSGFRADLAAVVEGRARAPRPYVALSLSGQPSTAAPARHMARELSWPWTIPFQSVLADLDGPTVQIPITPQGYRPFPCAKAGLLDASALSPSARALLHTYACKLKPGRG